MGSVLIRSCLLARCWCISLAARPELNLTRLILRARESNLNNLIHRSPRTTLRDSQPVVAVKRSPVIDAGAHANLAPKPLGPGRRLSLRPQCWPPQPAGRPLHTTQLLSIVIRHTTDDQLATRSCGLKLFVGDDAGGGAGSPVQSKANYHRWQRRGRLVKSVGASQVGNELTLTLCACGPANFESSLVRWRRRAAVVGGPPSWHTHARRTEHSWPGERRTKHERICRDGRILQLVAVQ